MTSSRQTSSTPSLSLEQARALARRLVRVSADGRRRLRADVVEHVERVAVYGEDGRAVWQIRRSARLVFRGGAWGEHSLDLAATSSARALAHWQGYCSAHGLDAEPRVGELVHFECGSASGGVRDGRVLAVHGTSVRVAFRYAYGRRSERTVPISTMRFGRELEGLVDARRAAGGAL